MKAWVVDAVLRSNAHWPFKKVNRIPYSIAINRIKKNFSRFPQVQSIYLREGMTRSDWVPGLSDIDLTVICANEVCGISEYKFLQTFWTEYSRMKRMFPMLGEVELITEQDLPFFLTHTLRGHESKNWKHLWGKLKPDARAAVPDSREREMLNAALHHYVDTLHRFCWNPIRNFVEESRMLRVSRKICRYLGVSHTDGRELLQLLEERVEKEFPNEGKRVSFKTVAGNWGPEIRSVACNLKFHSAVRAVYGDENGADYVVLKSSLSEKEFREALSETRVLFTSAAKKPVLLTETVFKYLVQCAEPLRYVYLYRRTGLLHGEDIFATLLPPLEKDFKRNLIESCHYTLKAVRSAEPPLVNVTSCLMLYLYFKTGILQTDFEDLLAEYKAHLPDLFSKIQPLRATESSDEENVGWYLLSRELITLTTTGQERIEVLV